MCSSDLGTYSALPFALDGAVALPSPFSRDRAMASTSTVPCCSGSCTLRLLRPRTLHTHTPAPHTCSAPWSHTHAHGTQHVAADRHRRCRSLKPEPCVQLSGSVNIFSHLLDHQAPFCKDPEPSSTGQNHSSPPRHSLESPSRK